MNDKELWKLISIISEGQDSEQRRKVEQYITDLQKEIERLNNIINELEKWLEERSGDVSFAYHHTLNKLQELKGNDK